MSPDSVCLNSFFQQSVKLPHTVHGNIVNIFLLHLVADFTSWKQAVLSAVFPHRVQIGSLRATQVVQKFHWPTDGHVLELVL